MASQPAGKRSTPIKEPAARLRFTETTISAASMPWRLTCGLRAELHGDFPLFPLVHGKLPRHLMRQRHNLHLVNRHWLQIQELVPVAARLDHVILGAVEEDGMTVVAVAGHPGELGGALCDAVHPQVIGGDHHVLAHQHGAAQLVRQAAVGDGLHRDAVRVGGQVELLDEGLCPAPVGDAHTQLLVHRDIVAADGAPARRDHRGVPADDHALGKLFDQVDAAGIRHNVFADLVDADVQGPCPVAGRAEEVHAQAAGAQAVQLLVRQQAAEARPA